jgi:hypothetical protein
LSLIAQQTSAQQGQGGLGSGGVLDLALMAAALRPKLVVVPLVLGR